MGHSAALYVNIRELVTCGFNVFSINKITYFYCVVRINLSFLLHTDSSLRYMSFQNGHVVRFLAFFTGGSKCVTDTLNKNVEPGLHIFKF